MGKDSKWQRRALIILCAVLALILAGLIAATAFARYYLGLIGRYDENDDTLSPDHVATMTDPADFPDGPGVSQRIPLRPRCHCEGSPRKEGVILQVGFFKMLYSQRGEITTELDFQMCYGILLIRTIQFKMEMENV